MAFQCITIRGGTKFTIHTPDRKFLMLENNSITVNGQDGEQENPALQFFIDRAITINLTEEIFRFRPVLEQTKFVAVSGKKLVLKDLSQVTDNSHNFIVHIPNDDYMKYEVANSPFSNQTFITARNTTGQSYEAIIDVDSENALFRPVNVDTQSAMFFMITDPFTTNELVLQEQMA